MPALPQKSFFYELEAASSPDWQAAFLHLEALGLELLQLARRSALEAQGIREQEINQLVRQDSEKAQVLNLMTAALSEISKSMQEEYDAGERYWSWRVNRNDTPHYQGDTTGMLVLPFILLGVMDAAGFAVSFDDAASR